MRVFHLCLLISTNWSCRDRDSTRQDSGSVAPTPSLSERAGCSELPSPFTSVQLSETNIPTVPRLEWWSDTPLTPTLVLDPGEGDLLETPGQSDAGLHGQVLALGTPALRSASAVLVIDTDAGRACSDELPFQTQLLSSEIPEITLSSTDPERAEGGYTLVHLMTESLNYATILDEAGQFIWAHPATETGMARVVASLDRQSVLYLTLGVNEDGMSSTTSPGSITRLGLDGEVIQTVEMQGIHTDFVELPDGGFAALSWDMRELTDESGTIRKLVGDTLMIASPDGETETIWSSFDHFDPNLEVVYTQGGFADPEAEDWSHANGLDYDPEADAYFISVAGVDTVVRVEGATGEQTWALGSTGGDFLDSANTVHGPHSIEHLGDDRVLLFNRNLSQTGDLPEDSDQCSEAIELQLDVENMGVIKLWSYGSEECLWVVYFGEARRLEGGNTLVIFSSAGQIDEATPEGDTVWRVNTDVGAAFGFGDRVSGFQLDEVLEP